MRQIEISTHLSVVRTTLRRALKFGLENIVQEGQSQRQAMLGVQQGTQTAGTVLQEAIAKVLSDTPGTQDQTILVEVGRAV